MAAPVNPFEHAHVVLQDLKARVDGMTADLQEERQLREFQVNELSQALHQERAERQTVCDGLAQKLLTEEQKRDNAIQRTRQDVGDLRMSLEQEVKDRLAHCREIHQSLIMQGEQLNSRIEELQAMQSSHHHGFSQAISDESSDRITSHNNLDMKFTSMANQLRSDVEQLSKTLAANTLVTESDHNFIGSLLSTFRNWESNPVTSRVHSEKVPGGLSADSDLKDLCSHYHVKSAAPTKSLGSTQSTEAGELSGGLC